MPTYRHPNTGSEIETTEADFAANLAPQGFEPVEEAPESTGAPNLKGMKRDELDAYAAEQGVADPASLPNKDAVIEAIEGSGEGAAGDTTLADAQPSQE